MYALKLLWRYLKKYIVLFFLSVIMLIFLNYLRSIIPMLTGEFVAIIDPSVSESTLPSYLKFLYHNATLKQSLLITALLVCMVALIRETVNIFCDVSITKLSEQIGISIQKDYFNKVQDLPYSYLNHAETGDLIQRSTQDVYRFKTFVNGSLMELFNSLCKVIIYGTAMFFINVEFTAYVFLILPIYFITSYVYFKSQERDFTHMEVAEGKMTSVLQENLTGIRVVKAFANEKYEIKKFNESVGNFTKWWDRVNKKSSLFWGVSDFLTYFQIIVVFGLSIFFVTQRGMGLPQVVIMFLYTQSIAWPCRNLGRQLAEFGKTSICAKRIVEILDMKSEYQDEKGTKPIIKGNIQFEHVSFQFEDASIPTLKDINVSIHQGETVAIIGKTGSGKSTFVNLLNRLLDPTEGVVYLDEHDITKIDKKWVRKNVGIILQEPFLYSKTIEENINITLPYHDEKKARELASIANVDHDIEQFQEKYTTMVGERGVTLSGGQKQRIAIARMLAEKKAILVFDDSLSAVDTETDLKIRKALKEKEGTCTMIIITHRITTAKDADKIIVFEDGKVSDMGTHEELIQRPSLYQTIWNIQNYFHDKPLLNGGDENV